ncbi:hypothetical protein OG914_16835 [Streptomyces sp. NBC_00291]|uniref:hypothetical protein n=1 Tax=Streptomyces sp. NBC_00291 TaxID=2975704 RepID=UPI00225BB0A5|nr:hypothetical protein [Streptomyces sp. NBC_00291]MCX5155651.1 hypothetical protein [Streptomyces sp. NBC_00291]
MSWQLALDYIRALIWPVVVLALGIMLRRQLAGLFNRVESVETPLGTVAFDTQAAAIAEETGEIANNIQDEVVTAESERRPLSNEDSPALPTTPGAPTVRGYYRVDPRPTDAFSDLLELAETETTAAVLGAWREVDTAIRKATVERGLFRPLPRTLSPKDVLSPELSRSAQDLLELRNRVVHQGDVIPTVSGARSYVTAANRIVDALALTSNPALQHREYEDQAIRAVSMNSAYVKRNDGDAGFDAYAETEAGGSFAVDIRHRRNNRLTMEDVKAVADRFPQLDLGVLLLTNSPLSQEVRDFNATSGDSRPRMEVVQWRDSADDDVLARAIARVAG